MPAHPVSTPFQARALARSLVERHGGSLRLMSPSRRMELSPGLAVGPVDAVRLAARLGLRVIRRGGAMDAPVSWCARIQAGSIQPLLEINARIPDHQQQWVVAHEIGHVMLGGLRLADLMLPAGPDGLFKAMQLLSPPPDLDAVRPEGPPVIGGRSSRRVRGPSGLPTTAVLRQCDQLTDLHCTVAGSTQGQADAFARALLMPDDALELLKRWPQATDDWSLTARLFGVNPSVMQLRLREHQEDLSVHA